MCFYVLHLLLQDDQATDAKGLAFSGPQSFDELESEDLYTKYKVFYELACYKTNTAIAYVL